MSESQTCYVCGRPATSDEHVPPRFLFPALKDLPEHGDLRKNLITVPSCDEHNSGKSKDDEYACAILFAHINSNAVAGAQVDSKLYRAFKRSPGFLALVAGARKPVIVDGKHTYALEFDHDRIYKQFEWMARGVYWHHHRERWEVPVAIHVPTFLDAELQAVPGMAELVGMNEVLLSAKPWQGANPQVFRYKAFVCEERSLRVIELQFFEGVSVIACSADGAFGAKS